MFCLFKICFAFWHFYYSISMLFYTVCLKERTFNANDIITTPIHNKTRFFCYSCYKCCFKIFFCRFSYEFICIFSIYNNCHTFLRFRNSKFCSIKTIIFFLNFIKFNYKTIS